MAEWLELLGPGDLLVLTADHGCDVTAAAHRPHARARAAAGVFDGDGSRRHDGPLADVGASAAEVARRADTPGPARESFI